MSKRIRLTPRCFNPFKEPHNKDPKNLRKFRDEDLWKFPEADETSMLCVRCRFRVKEYIPPEPQEEDIISSQASVHNLSKSAEISTPESSVPRTVSNFSDNLCDYNDHSLEQFLKIPFIEKDRLYSEKNYGVKKLDESYAALQNKFRSQFGILPESTYSKINQDHCSMIAKVKELYNAETDTSIKKKLLSILPDNWGISQIQSEFNCSRTMLLSLKKTINESNNADSEASGKSTEKPNPVKFPGNQPLNLDIKKLVIDFYESEENSKQLAGMKDFKSVKNCDGDRIRVQKKLVLCNLKELYQNFKAQYDSVPIQFSKFASLRPAHCILAGSSGTHVVCVCTIHQNVKLMLEGCNFPKFAKNTHWIVESQPIYKNLLNKLVCTNPTELCYFGTCKRCPNNEEIVDYFRASFNEFDIDEIQYKMWTSTDRCTIVDVTSDSDEFMDTLVTHLDKLLKHDFIAKTQSRYFSDTKLNLKNGEFAVVVDFAENYAFVVQEAAQAFHWNNDQATIFPMVVYYNEDNAIKHCSLVGISDCLKHDTVLIYLFQEQLIAYLKKKFAVINKILYFSDGAPQQFKNKKAFTNLCYHNADFKINAEWHFFATAHGKGPCDGLAGSVKRLAARASLQMDTKKHILTPQDLYTWATKNFTGVDFTFITNEEYLNKKNVLDVRYFPSKTVKGTQSLHTVLPINDEIGYAYIKSISTSEKSSKIKVF